MKMHDVKKYQNWWLTYLAHSKNVEEIATWISQWMKIRWKWMTEWDNEQQMNNKRKWIISADKY